MKKILIALLCILCCTSAIVFADEDSFSKTISIVGQHEIENNTQLKSGRFTFVLTANDGAPMPADSINGVKEVTINLGEKFNFGDITYTKPGTYTYTVSRNITKSKNLKQDEAVYNVTVTVYNEGDPTIIFEKVGTEGKPDEIKYVDKYIPDKVSKTKTGDDTHFLLYIISCLISIFLLMVLLIKKIKTNRN